MRRMGMAIPVSNLLTPGAPGSPKCPNGRLGPHFPKEDFQIDLAAGTCTCPAGQVTRTVRRRGFYATATAAAGTPALFPL